MTKILITGGSGFIGTNAVENFSRKGYQVLNVDLNPPRNQNHREFWTECDILSYYRYEAIVHDFQPDFFLHLAARTDLTGKRVEDYAANVQGVKNTVSVLAKCKNLKRAIFASSRMVCKIGYQPAHDSDYCPPNAYGQSKVLGEEIVRNADLGFSWLIVRPTSIWGPWFDVPYNIFFAMIRKGYYFHARGLNPRKSFGYVGNTVFQIESLFHAMQEQVNGKTIYLCDYPPLELREWAEIIRNEFQVGPIHTLPYPLLKTLALSGDVFHWLGWYKAPLTSFRLANLATDMVYRTEELQALCPRLPFSLVEGVKQTIAWMRETEALTPRETVSGDRNL